MHFVYFENVLVHKDDVRSAGPQSYDFSIRYSDCHLEQ